MAAAVFVVLVEKGESGFCCGRETATIGGIVPHHDLANQLTDEFYQALRAKNKNIKTFIILAPNHANIGSEPVIASLSDWQTKQGVATVDAELFGQLKSLGFVGVDEKNIAIEHGISTQLPFIKKYFPDARVVPLAFSTQLRTAESFQLAQELKKILENKNVFLLASLDFSHYLPLSVALEKDKQTAKAVQDFDYGAIASFDSDNVDSPQALITFLRAMELAGAKNITEWAHKSSSDFLAGEAGGVTTYLYWWFGK